MRKWKLIVVDDSLLFRQAIVQSLKDHPLIQVVATAADPYEARDRIMEFEPEVMVLDVEMPRMNGIDFLKKLLPQYPIPVIVMSSVAEHVFRALECGAVDFLPKPSARNSMDVETFMKELHVKIRVAARVSRSLIHSSESPQVIKEKQSMSATPYRMIAIGASTGGTEAILTVLKGLPRECPGIVVVQHMPPGFTKSYAERLDATTLFKVKEAESGDEVRAGEVLVAPGNQQMRVVKQGNRYLVDCYIGDKVNGHSPSVDVLFESVARVAGPRALGVLLTGMGSDGARGLLNMRRQGARTIGQDQASSVVYGMPKAAFELGGVEKQTSLQLIPHNMKKMLWNESDEK